MIKKLLILIVIFILITILILLGLGWYFFIYQSGINNPFSVISTDQNCNATKCYNESVWLMNMCTGNPIKIIESCDKGYCLEIENTTNTARCVYYLNQRG